MKKAKKTHIEPPKNTNEMVGMGGLMTPRGAGRYCGDQPPCGGLSSPKTWLVFCKKKFAVPFPGEGRERGETEMDSEKVMDIDQLVVSAGVLGKILGISDRRVRGLAEEGVIMRVSSGRYKLAESVHSYILNLKVAQNAKDQMAYDGSLDLDEERAIHERVKRQIAELKYSVMRGELHKAEDVEDVMNAILSNFKARLEGMPAKLVPKLYKRGEDKSYILNVLQEAVSDALKELSEYNPSDFYGDGYIAANEEEDE